MVAKKQDEAHAPVQPNQRQPLGWSDINWRKVKREVGRTQRRIFWETRKGRLWKVAKEQKRLCKSFYARLLAVLIVTELNEGRNTPGVDGRICKTDEEKMQLVHELGSKKYKPSPVWVVYIPKPGGGKRRLGIPTIRDRAEQALVKLAMDPEWEARFEPNSYGFRPGRRAIDATLNVVNLLTHRKRCRLHPGWILDADISQCFDNIDHAALLEKIGTSPFRHKIKMWLKSGAISEVGFETTGKGTPQGGVISPLLANIALDGIERLFGIYTASGNYKSPSRRSGPNKDVSLIRYADDFIVVAPSKSIIENHVVPKVRQFLKEMGLDLNKAKTRIVNISDGFEFLGFRFQRYYRRDGTVKRLCYSPSRKRVDRFLRSLRGTVRLYRTKDVQRMILAINRRVRGFCNYYRWSMAHKMFAYMTHRLWVILWRWALRRHPKRGRRWLVDHYWRRVGRDKWTFSWHGTRVIHPYKLCVKWWLWAKIRITTSPYDTKALSSWARVQSRRSSVSLLSGGW